MSATPLDRGLADELSSLLVIDDPNHKPRRFTTFWEKSFIRGVCRQVRHLDASLTQSQRATARTIIKEVKP